MHLIKKRHRHTVIVGVNEGHDGGAAVMIDGEIRCAISEERLNRQRYSRGYLNACFYCLQHLDLAIEDVTLFVFSSYGEKLPTHYTGAFAPLGLPSNRCISVDHHLSHALGAYCLSPFNDALVVIVDGQGNNNDTESYYVCRQDGLEKIGGNSPHRNPAKGIGRTYEAFTNFLGWTDQEAGKTMGLAAYGSNTTLRTPLFELKDTEVSGALEEKYERGVIEFGQRSNLDLGTPYSKGITQTSRDVAAYVQSETERIMSELIVSLVRKTGLHTVCLAGGVALNCNANSRILRSEGVRDLFIIPAASDRGQALGNVLYGHWILEKRLPKLPLRNDYFGREYSENEIRETLERRSFTRKMVPTPSLAYERPTTLEETVARLLAEGNIVGWFQDGSELGPRALGHRSLLGDPRHADMKERLNHLKQRESFRPLAPSCLLERSQEYFDFDRPSPYMLFTMPVIPSKQAEIPAVVHADGSARIQTVAKSDGRFHHLLAAFDRLTGVPVLLNTSFNIQGPIVETPADALTLFAHTGIDYLVLGDYLVRKI
jgi:carbamoyltransferase